MSKMTIPAEDWDLACKALNECAQYHNEASACRVQVRCIQGRFFVGFEGVFWPYTDSDSTIASSIKGWWLKPEADFAGIKYCGYELLSQGRPGMLFEASQGRFVADEPVEFSLGLPRSSPLSIEEAKRLNDQESSRGWRNLCYEGQSPTWRPLGGHPVAVYRDNVGARVLIYKKASGVIGELMVSSDVRFDDEAKSEIKSDCPAKSARRLFMYPEDQLSFTF